MTVKLMLRRKPLGKLPTSKAKPEKEISVEHPAPAGTEERIKFQDFDLWKKSPKLLSLRSSRLRGAIVAARGQLSATKATHVTSTLQPAQRGAKALSVRI